MDFKAFGKVVNEVEYALEDAIDFWVLMASFPPSFNDSIVISVNNEEAAKLRERGESEDEELKAHCLCPTNVLFTILSLPARN